MWIDLLCILNETSERGRLVLPNGEAMPDEAIARNLGIDVAKWKQMRSNLVTLGVASQDEAGVLYNRRIVRDNAIRKARAESGRVGGKAKRTPSKPPSKSEAEGGSSVAVAVSASLQQHSFDEVWVVCRRGSKRQAEYQYRKAVPAKVSHESLLAAWKSHVASASEPKYVAHLFRWIRDERWEESPPGANGHQPARVSDHAGHFGQAARFVK